MTWRDLLVIVRQSPLGSALDRAMNPGESGWGIAEHLAAAAVDALRVSNWQRAAGKREDYPKPIPRPGVEDDTTRHGKTAITIEELQARIAKQQSG